MLSSRSYREIKIRFIECNAPKDTSICAIDTLERVYFRAFRFISYLPRFLTSFYVIQPNKQKHKEKKRKEKKNRVFSTESNE